MVIHSRRGQGKLVVAAVAALVVVAATAWCAPTPPPERSLVAVARAERILVPAGIRAPTWLYPEGRVEEGVVEKLLDAAVIACTGRERTEDAWRALISPNDRVGIQIDPVGTAAHDAMLDVLVRCIAKTGVPLRNITIYAGDEAALFRAGFDLSGRMPGVTVLASDALGYRKGISRVALEHCTKIINLARLRVDPRLGMHGAIANCLQAVPYAERRRLERDPTLLPTAAGNSVLRRMIVLHILDALFPIYRYPEVGEPALWQFGGVMASTDPVALDAIGRQVLLDKLRAEDVDPQGLALPVVWLQAAAETYRLGTADLTRIDVVTAWPLGEPQRNPPAGG